MTASATRSAIIGLAARHATSPAGGRYPAHVATYAPPTANPQCDPGFAHPGADVVVRVGLDGPCRVSHGGGGDPPGMAG